MPRRTLSTTATLYSPYPLKWSAIRADFCVTDGYTQPNVDNTVRISGMDPSNGQITLASAADSNFRWVLVKF